MLPIGRKWEMDSLVPTWTHLTSFFASVIIPTVAGWLCDLNVNISSFGAVAEYCSLGDSLLLVDTCFDHLQFIL